MEKQKNGIQNREKERGPENEPAEFESNAN